MSESRRTPADPAADDIDLLLPWYATGTLTPAEAARVEEALARDPSLAHRLELTRDEMGEAVALAEDTPGPSPRARERVFDRIAAIEDARPLGVMEAGRAVASRVRHSDLVERLIGLVAGYSPRSLAYAGVAAALLLAVQAGVIGSLLLDRGGGATFGTASDPGAGGQEGTFALVGFAPGASASQISSVLAETGASITAGPSAGDIYSLRIAAKAVSMEERDRLIARLRDQKDVISFAAPRQ